MTTLTEQEKPKASNTVAGRLEQIIIRDSVKLFSEKMEGKLRLNDYKGGWGNCEILHLINRLRSEMSELDSAIRQGDDSKIVDEAIDVANFAMMIADNHSV